MPRRFVALVEHMRLCTKDAADAFPSVFTRRRCRRDSENVAPQRKRLRSADDDPVLVEQPSPVTSGKISARGGSREFGTKPRSPEKPKPVTLRTAHAGSPRPLRGTLDPHRGPSLRATSCGHALARSRPPVARPYLRSVAGRPQQDLAVAGRRLLSLAKEPAAARPCDGAAPRPCRGAACGRARDKALTRPPLTPKAFQWAAGPTATHCHAARGKALPRAAGTSAKACHGRSVPRQGLAAGG